MEENKDLRKGDLMYLVDEEGERVSVARVCGTDNGTVSVEYGDNTVTVSPDLLKPIPANRGRIWEQNGFTGIGGVSAYCESIGPKIVPYPTAEPREVMAVIVNERAFLVFHDRMNPLLPEGRQHMVPYTYLHEIQHAYQDYGYMKEWKYVPDDNGPEINDDKQKQQRP